MGSRVTPSDLGTKAYYGPGPKFKLQSKLEGWTCLSGREGELGVSVGEEEEEEHLLLKAADID